MIVHVINLPHRADRLRSVQQQAAEQGFDIKVFEGVINSNTRLAVCKAHKNVVQYAKDKKLKKIIIAEDDVKFFGKGAFDFYIKKIPKDFDIYFSMIYSGKIDSDNRIIKGYSGNTLYTIHERFYNFFLNEVPDDCYLDRFLGESCDKHKYVVCNPFVCFQSGSYSDRARRAMDYTPLLAGRNLYSEK